MLSKCFITMIEFRRSQRFLNVERQNSNFEWGCCCCGDIQIAPLVHYTSTHSLDTWTQPPPTLTLGAMVPDSASCGWRMAWVVTLPVVWRWSWWPLCHQCVCVCEWGTMVFVCLTSLPFVPPWSWQRKTKDIVSAATKRSSFSRLLKPVFHHHLSIAWWRLWPLDKEGRSRVSRDWAMRCW